METAGKRNDSREVDKNWINWITRGGSRLQFDVSLGGTIVAGGRAVDWHPGIRVRTFILNYIVAQIDDANGGIAIRYHRYR